MTYNRKVTGRALSAPAAFTIGVCSSIGITLLQSAILAKLISLEKLEWEKIGYGIIVILLIASAIGAKVTCLVLKRRKILCCFLSGVLYWLGLLIIAALFYGGQYSGMGVSGAIILCGCAVVCLQEVRSDCCTKTPTAKGKRRKKHYNPGR